VLNPPDSLEEGQEVHVKKIANPTVAAPPAATAQPTPPGNSTPAAKKS